MGRSNHASVLRTPSPTILQRCETVKGTSRPTPDSKIRQFGQWLVGYPWVEVLTIRDVTEKWNNYLSTINQAYHHFFATKTQHTHPADLPWMTSRIKALMQQRNRAFHTDRARYRALRNTVIREIAVAKKEYYPQELQHLEGNNTSKLSEIRHLCDLGNPSSAFLFLPFSSSPLEIAELINSHFSTICQSFPH